ncbi:DUF72 domain-containing protein [Rhodanobacter sp. AS-Z3]|uniref:DUF72 domain-containing protein n=1 Tax=Rhodanobacter sp. AS-Z3 TaxID=3031330 RepID=UPI002479E629|nr:DUF72 domain-containing protein [Rhodanobacter sp. AS-Z3]WEN14862.1 DUF72 domain-containing protein [Rhodanobacter sp. AS-Z3]
MTRRSTDQDTLFIGCAGWSLASAQAPRFRGQGSHLERYAQHFQAVEINSSFYRPHRATTWRRWADSVPAEFRFAVKMPRAISHEARLLQAEPMLQDFIDQVSELGPKLGCLLLQLPPSLAYQAEVVLPFFDLLACMYSGPVACEPRHLSWFQPAVSRALRAHGVARVAADPARIPRAAVPAGDHRLQYFRLHGAPRIYCDAYNGPALQGIARRLLRSQPAGAQRWCIFDNTAQGHALENALDLIACLDDPAGAG